MAVPGARGMLVTAQALVPVEELMEGLWVEPRTAAWPAERDLAAKLPVLARMVLLAAVTVTVMAIVMERGLEFQHFQSLSLS